MTAQLFGCSAYLQQICQVPLRKGHEVVVEFDKLEMFFIKQATLIERGKVEALAGSPVATATYLLTPILPNVFVREISGRMQARSLR